jgi:uncharacterized protein
MINRLTTWFKGHLPTRETIAANRWLKPFAHQLLRPDLWRFNRRSVPRAVAVGLSVGVLIPLAHTVVAAALAIPTRANIVIAAAVTWIVSNPATWYPLYGIANRIGDSLRGTHSGSAAQALKAAWNVSWEQWFSVLQNEGKSAALGILVMAPIIAAVGYVLSSFLWRLRIARKWRARKRRT